MEPIIIALVNPLSVGDESVTALEFKRPLRAGDLRGIPVAAVAFDHMLIIAGRLCGQPPKVMEKLEGEDVMSVIEVVGSFLGTGRLTGA